ncbi:hypothetical protein CDAR_319511 [Caerostris darwini]|uniref:Uncharacterized protein n=1 Tax=Caerostris darwini TaxID=1538125 RepID=A0AAV4V9A7_9ARAC|nr:hypothetical protein CDAR_319511 [Caerostris darwini]
MIETLWLQCLSQQAQSLLSISKDPFDDIVDLVNKIISLYNSSSASFIAKTDTTVTNSSSFEGRKIEALEATIVLLNNNLMNFLFVIDYAADQEISEAVTVEPDLVQPITSYVTTTIN